jgi:hypothetical protein
VLEAVAANGAHPLLSGHVSIESRRADGISASGVGSPYAVDGGNVKKQELESLLSRGGDVPDLGKIEDHLHAVASEVQLPSLAIAICAARIEEAAPGLRAVLVRAADGETLSNSDRILVFRGLYILGAARDEEAYRPLLRLLRRPEPEVEHLLGDAVTEGLAMIAAGVFDGDADTLLDAISDRSIDEFARKALFGAATFLAWEGRIPLDRMRRFLEQFHDLRLAADEDHAWIGWLDAIALLGLREMAPLVHGAWDEGRIAPGALDRSDFEGDLSAAERAPDDIARFRRAGLGYIEDVIEALEWTRCTPSIGRGL